MPAEFRIGNKVIGAGHPVFVVAEMSANHNQSFDQALKIVHAAKEAGADAIKLQTYTADTMTLACTTEPFQIRAGSLWDGRNLHDLYKEAYTPWEWQPKLKAAAEDLGLEWFSTPFDASSVDFLEGIGAPCHKVASFEVVDIPLLETIGRTGKPVIMSTGMATLGEIDEAVSTLREHGASSIALLKCTSSYPAPPESMNLRAIPELATLFGTPAGLSDHTLGTTVPVAAVALGACIIEKHFTISRELAGPDSAFSLEPAEFRAMVDAVRITEKALGTPTFGPNQWDRASRVFRRSLFISKHVEVGQTLTADNVRSVRPSHGLAPKHYAKVLGRRARRDLPVGTPLDWSHFE